MKKVIFTILFLFLSSTAYAVNYSNDANCMGSWGMEDDGNETDRSGEGETLTETSGDIPQSATKQEGTYSRDFEFTSDSEYLEHADGGSTEINGANQSISMVAWFRRESETGSGQSIIGKYDGASGDDRQYLFLGQTDESMRCLISSDGTSGNVTVAITPASVLSNGTWAHVACVYNDTDIRIYIDGSLASNGGSNPIAHTAGISNEPSRFMLGANDSNAVGTNYADGLIDDVGIFDRELSSAEVSDIYNNTLAGAAASARRIIMVH